MNILVTGGTGFIGSHVSVELINNGYDIVIIDNLSNSSIKVLNRINRITGKKVQFYEGDIGNTSLLDKIFTENKIDACIHFAGLKAVGESVQKPLEYYENNISKTLVLLKCMSKYGVKKIIFSSSATVYGTEPISPITELNKKGTCTNPYGWTKSFIEQILSDLHTSDKEWNIVVLRYFNPIGAHKSGLIGEDPKGLPNNLVPYITKVASGKLTQLNVFGDDYETKDGTGVRDYIHVVDLAEGHIKAIDKLNENPDYRIYNLGTGKGYSVLEIVKMFEKVSGKKIPYIVTDRRPGDIATYYCNPQKALNELGWKAKNDLREMCEDSWNWTVKNPDGYGK